MILTGNKIVRSKSTGLTVIVTLCVNTVGTWHGGVFDAPPGMTTTIIGHKLNHGYEAEEYGYSKAGPPHHRVINLNLREANAIARQYLERHWSVLWDR